MRFLGVLLRSTYWVHTHRAEAAAIAERERPTGEAYALKAGDHYIGTNALTFDPAINQRGLDAVLQAQLNAALIAEDA